MRKQLLLLITTGVFVFNAPATGETVFTGSIRGIVIDGETRQPLPGANIVLVDTTAGSIAGDDGRFVLSGLPVGSYKLRASMIGYEAQIRSDLVVRSNRITAIEVRLQERALGLAETVVTAGYFSEELTDEVSAVNFNFEEIRRSPGSAQDISRLVQALPSINMNNDQRNDLVVRGGSPTENLTLVDNIEIPNINHFPTQGASGGPIGLLNVDLIEDATFSAGGFGAQFGDRLSSVLEIRMRDGNREEFDAELNMSMAGAGFIVEGPLSGGRGSWVASARRSYLDLLVGAIGTGAVPVYSDWQGKLSYDFNDRHQFDLLGVAGFDLIELKPKDADDAVDGEDFFKQDVNQVVAGANWRWLFSPSGYSETSLALTANDFGMRVNDNPTRVRLFDNDSLEREITLRNKSFYRPKPGLAVESGFDVKRIGSDFQFFVAADTNRVNVVIPELRIENDVSTTKLGGYVGFKQELAFRVQLRAGARLDYFDYNEEVDWSPRLAASFKLNDLTSLNAAWGIYYQNLPPSLLVQHPDNRRLENPRADHFVMGINRQVTTSTQLTVEAYRKKYRELPYDPDDPTISVVDAYADFGSPVPGRLIGGGTAKSDGIELLLQKKLAQALYGTAGYSFSRSRYTDLLGTERDRNFDNRHLVSLIVGYRPSDRWEYSLRWVYAGGRPRTPFDVETSSALNTGIIDPALVNSKRYESYHRLDLRFDHRRHYASYNLVLFFSVLNTYNRANIFTYYWDNEDREVDRIDQWKLLPIGGFELEF